MLKQDQIKTERVFGSLLPNSVFNLLEKAEFHDNKLELVSNYSALDSHNPAIDLLKSLKKIGVVDFDDRQLLNIERKTVVVNSPEWGVFYMNSMADPGFLAPVPYNEEFKLGEHITLTALEGHTRSAKMTITLDNVTAEKVTASVKEHGFELFRY